MDHAYIEEHHVADRYVQGTLPPEEAERFENHYLSCPECLDRLDLAEAMARGFQRVAQQDAVGQLAVVAWLARLGRRRQLGVLLSALLVAVLPAGLGLLGASEGGRELARNAAETARLRSQLDAERAARSQTERQLTQALQVSLLFLGAERGAPGKGGPMPEVRLPAVLSVPVNSPLRSTYRAVLRGGGRELRIEGLRPAGDAGDETLSLLLRTALPPGDYTLTVEGLAGSSYAFRIVR